MQTQAIPSQDENCTRVDGVVTDSRASSAAQFSRKWQAWMLRPIVLFAAAYTIIGILHELAHALTAYALNVPFTLFHVGVNLDPAHATLYQRAAIGVAGPLFALAIGLLCWCVYRRAQGLRSELLLLYLVMFGTGTFFGNLVSTSFVGDFSRAASAFQLPMPIRYCVSVAGLLCLCVLSFLIGKELRKWAPPRVGGAKAMLGVIALPAIIGTAIVVLVYLPMPSAFAVARIAESSFWTFGAVGALLSRKQATESNRNLSVGWADFATLLLAVLVVRVMARGIAFVP